MRIILALALSAALAGCSQTLGLFNTLSGLTITQSQIDAAHAAYTGGFLAVASAYRANYTRNPCAAGQRASISDPCSEREVVIRMQAIDRTVSGAFDRLDIIYAECTGGVTASCSGLRPAYDVLYTSLEAAKAVAAEFAWIVGR